MQRKELVNTTRDACDEQSEAWLLLDSIASGVKQQLDELTTKSHQKQLRIMYDATVDELKQLEHDQESIEAQIRDQQEQLRTLGRRLKTQPLLGAGKEALEKLTRQMHAAGNQARTENQIGALLERGAVQGAEKRDQPQQPQQGHEIEAREPNGPDREQVADEQDEPPGIHCQGRPLTRAQTRRLKKEQAAEDVQCPGEPSAAASTSR